MSSFIGNVNGNVVGNVIGNVIGNVLTDSSGNSVVTGNVSIVGAGAVISGSVSVNNNLFVSGDSTNVSGILTTATNIVDGPLYVSGTINGDLSGTLSNNTMNVVGNLYTNIGDNNLADLTISGNFAIPDNKYIKCNKIITNNPSDTLYLSDGSGNTCIIGTFEVNDTTKLSGNTMITGTLDVTGATNLETLTASGNTILNGSIINIGTNGSIVNIMGTTNKIQTTDLMVNDKLITLNKGGTSLSIGGAGIEFEENNNITGYIKVASDRASYDVKIPNSNNYYTMLLKDASGNMDISGNITVNTNKFNVIGTSGNTTISGTLGVTGMSTLTGNTTVGGTLGVTGMSTLTNLKLSTLSFDSSSKQLLTINGTGVVGYDNYTNFVNMAANNTFSGTNTFNNTINGTISYSNGLYTYTNYGSYYFTGRTDNVANTLVARDVNGYINVAYVNGNISGSSTSCTGNAATASNPSDGGSFITTNNISNYTSSSTPTSILNGSATVYCPGNGGVYMNGNFVYSYSWIGINTNPSFPLHVNGSNNEYYSGYTWWLMFQSISNDGYWNGYVDISIKASNKVSCSGVGTWSDKRIKTNIVDVNDVSALAVIRKIEPKLYTYVDKIRKGTEPVWGFIAQQIREVLPYAVSIDVDYIPNIYSIGQVLVDKVTVTTKFDLSTLTITFDASNNRLPFKIKFNNKLNKDVDKMVASIIDNHTLTVTEAFTNVELGFDEKEPVEITDIFMYGQEIQDFHTLTKDAIFTVATAALQEVDRQQQTDNTRINNLETENIELKNRITTLENQILTLQTNQTDIIAIKKLLNL